MKLQTFIRFFCYITVITFNCKDKKLNLINKTHVQLE